ncbi:MAG: bacillithiol biosynthesis deacetylase BshB1 [Candidatus Eisenbacteria bacterium]|uniref:Bacillithiol biosynthesis deacetylase BshB1 n=1 Tax=Eiseniibacteriota bacterium TaxID=2212470 RepID=A0A538TZG9_UNCEI|nr:MAG: bacillithiol biosynthesis deacetylase BshB1 [Candidatus Eisenbacteria bacterium]
MTLAALFFGAHPDDVELTSGGLATLLAGHGHAVGIVDLTRGEAGTRGSPEQRAAEAEAATRALGIEVRRNLALPDTGLDGGSAEQLAAVVACLREHRPSLVVAPDRHDLHPDHVEASRLVARACHLAGLARFRAAGERFRPDRLLYALYRSVERPHLVVDVTSVWERRMDALRAHTSQLEGSGPETYLTAQGFLAEVESRARVWGASIGVTFGEGYRVAGPVAVRDARALLGATP